MGLFRRKRIYPGDPSIIAYDDTWRGLRYNQVWRQKPQPDPGADAFAWETLQQAAYTAIGPGVHAIAQRFRPISGPYYTFPGVINVGVPTTAGQMALVPLLNPLQPVGGQV